MHAHFPDSVLAGRGLALLGDEARLQPHVASPAPRAAGCQPSGLLPVHLFQRRQKQLRSGVVGCEQPRFLDTLRRSPSGEACLIPSRGNQANHAQHTTSALCPGRSRLQPGETPGSQTERGGTDCRVPLAHVDVPSQEQPQPPYCSPRIGVAQRRAGPKQMGQRTDQRWCWIPQASRSSEPELRSAASASKPGDAHSPSPTGPGNEIETLH